MAFSIFALAWKEGAKDLPSVFQMMLAWQTMPNV